MTTNKKLYAVKHGRKPGIYKEWFGPHGAEVQIKGFAGARFKGFPSREEAEAWMKETPGAPAHTLPREKSSTRPTKHQEEAPPHHVSSSRKEIVIYTDGGCSNNPGPGGYGVVLLHDGQRQELSGGYAKTTNNRMELTACIMGLESLTKRHSVVVYSDSQYVVNGIEKGWARKWKSNDWKRTAREMAENSDLWARLLEACDKQDVTFKWVRGHDGNRENERCDVLAVEMSHCADLPPDHGYRSKTS
jgi:ribonuclease HI